MARLEGDLMLGIETADRKIAIGKPEYIKNLIENSCVEVIRVFMTDLSKDEAWFACEHLSEKGKTRRIINKMNNSPTLTNPN